MEYKNIIVEKEDKLLIITINRPKSLNSLNLEVLDELQCALYSAEENPEIRVVIITGAGEKAFISGADISGMKGADPIKARRFSTQGHRVLHDIEKLSKPVIAAVNGYALGGGLELAMACDLIYASENAKFGQPEINLGIIPGFGGCIRLQKLVGLWRAREMIFSGEIMNSHRAKELGIVLEVFPPDKFLQEVRAIAQKLAAKPPLAIANAKHAIYGSSTISMEPAIQLEKHMFSVLFSSEDAQEGVSAFLEKRAVNFKGR